ncbi:MAG: hypothetical protein LC808_20955 [Actinobacteria bacterium]|nr:hypothetical protein [Actinomycetota bacterium]
MVNVEEVTRYLDSHGVTGYELVPHSEAFASTAEFTESAGIDPTFVYKTLAVRYKTALAAVCISAASRLDFKRVQSALNWPKVSMARDEHLSELNMTHLGVTPFAECWSGVILDDQSSLASRIFVGAGLGNDVSIEPSRTASQLGWTIASVTG